MSARHEPAKRSVRRLEARRPGDARVGYGLAFEHPVDRAVGEVDELDGRGVADDRDAAVAIVAGAAERPVPSLPDDSASAWPQIPRPSAPQSFAMKPCGTVRAPRAIEMPTPVTLSPSSSPAT